MYQTYFSPFIYIYLDHDKRLSWGSAGFQHKAKFLSIDMTCLKISHFLPYLCCLSNIKFSFHTLILSPSQLFSCCHFPVISSVSTPFPNCLLLLPHPLFHTTHSHTLCLPNNPCLRPALAASLHKKIQA